MRGDMRANFPSCYILLFGSDNEISILIRNQSRNP